MNPEAASVALNALAFIGAAAFVVAQWRTRESTPLETRLAAFFALLMALVGVRALRWGLELSNLRRLEEALAAFIPLFALVLAEGLMRRHAPGWMKRVIAALSLAFMLAAFLRPDAAALTFAIALGVFMAGSLASIALLLALRRRQSLAPAENDAVSAMSAALIVALPLSATDFLSAAGQAPIRAGGLGLLVFVYAVARVSAAGGAAFGVLGDLAWALAAACLGLAAFAYVLGPPQPIAALEWFAILLALVLVIQIVHRVREMRRVRTQQTLWRAFAEAPANELPAFLDRLMAAPELERARLLEGASLADYDADALRKAFHATPVIAASEARAIRAGAWEQLAVLFDAQEATHAVLISPSPLRLLMVNMPRVGAGAEAELQLRVLARLAAGIEAHHA
ncbi:MAG: hypothetical protein AB7O04_02410 [Hyphomonadaceae bacterium]